MGTRRRGLWGLVTMMLTVTFLVGLWVGGGLNGRLVMAGSETFDDLKVFTEVLAALQKNYVEEVDTKELVYGAIRGMLAGLDPHSVFMPPEVYREVQVDTKGEFGGVGLQIGMRDNRLVVIAPIEDTPAARAGIKAGDRIIKVNEDPTKGMTLFDAVQKMRGPKGEKVALTVERANTPEPLVFEIVRDVIKIKSVKTKMLENEIGYLRISQFQEHTGRDTKEALHDLMTQDIQALVLDLRNNPGGLLSAAVEATEPFLAAGQLIVAVQGRDGAPKNEYRSHHDGEPLTVPIVVLVNQGSASGAEIMAGALQDWRRAVVLGSPSFGKGSVQTILPLSDGSGLRLTTAKYYTPDGRSIQSIGIKPDVVVEQAPAPHAPPPAGGGEGNGGEPQEQDLGKEPATEDHQLQKAIELLKTWDIFKDTLPIDTPQTARNIEKN